MLCASRPFPPTSRWTTTAERARRPLPGIYRAPTGRGQARSCARGRRPKPSNCGRQRRYCPCCADCDYGAWSGRPFDDVSAREPEAALRWLREPAAAPHGGETRSSASCSASRHGSPARMASRSGRSSSPTRPLFRAAIVHAIEATPPSFWRFDIAPLSITQRFERRERPLESHIRRLLGVKRNDALTLLWSPQSRGSKGRQEPTPGDDNAGETECEAASAWREDQRRAHRRTARQSGDVERVQSTIEPAIAAP